MRGQVSRVVLQGRLSQLREVQVLLADGDDTVMQIEPVAAR
jgi:hypothetical protein